MKAENTKGEDGMIEGTAKGALYICLASSCHER